MPGMPQQVFIKVVGFSDVERHALNTLFQLSRERPTSYWLWTAEAPAGPQLVLLDAQSYEARVEFESMQPQGLRSVWIGDDAPDGVWRSFQRPLAWPDVVEAMDELFTPQTEVEFDLDLGMEGDASDTVPPDEVPEDPAPARRALIAHPDLNERLYLRAKLALNHLTVADEAETAAQVLELMRGRSYVVALVDFGLPDADGWTFIHRLAKLEPPIPHLIVTKDHASPLERLRAWFAGVEAFFSKPADPEKLGELLRKV
jgi:CheY-like chemotaxis protein